MTDIRFPGPHVFDPVAVDPETAKFNKMIEELLAKMLPTHQRTPHEIREERESGRSWLGPIKRLEEAQDRVVQGQLRLQRDARWPLLVLIADLLPRIPTLQPLTIARQWRYG